MTNSNNCFPLVVSFYTPEYAEEVNNLIESCRRLQIPYEIDPIPSLGSWEQNCCHKPRYLLEKLKRWNRPLLWVDADAIFLRKPTLFETLNTPLALRVVQELPDKHPSKMITGTLFVRPQAVPILSKWETACQQRLTVADREEVWDQVVLRDLLQQQCEGRTIPCYPLPWSYYAVYDQGHDLSQAFICHFQASRLLKKVVDGLILSFWKEEMVTQQERLSFLKTMRDRES